MTRSALHSKSRTKRSKIRLSLEKLENRRMLASVSAPAILQWFESSFDTIENRTPDIFDAGYGAVWLPPPSRADSGNFSVGYDVYDHFDLGNADNPTLYGTETGLKTVAEQFNSAGVALHVDAVLNHAGFTDLGAEGFYESGGYPGMAITLPNAIDGDFHSGFSSGDNEGRLAGLIDIDHTTNHQFIRSPVELGNPDNLRPGTTPFNGRVANVPDEANRRFYPDRNLDPIYLFDPVTGDSGIPVYPFNANDPMAGDPVSENVLGYQMRWLQWMVQDVGVDSFRLDAAKHLDPFVMDYYDRAVYRSNPRLLLDGSVDHVYAYSEVFDGNKDTLLSYTKKNINSSDPGRIGGNRDALDFSAFFAMHDKLGSAGTPNAWYDVRDSLLDLHDDGIHNGSAGVLFVNSHDEAGPYELNNVAHAFTLMYPGNTVVYFNGKEFGDNRDFPKNGRGDALGGVYGDGLKRLVQIRNTHGRGNFLERNIDAEGLYVYERESSAVVGLSNRGDGGFDQRTVSVAFAPGTHLVELTGNASNTFIDPFDDIPDVVTVSSNGTIDIRIPRNRNAYGDFHGNGYVIYGLPTPQASAGLEILGTSSVVPGSVPAAQNYANGVTRLSDLNVITSDSFQVRLQTNEVRLLGSDSLRDVYADGDHAILRVDGGIDINGNGGVDFVVPGDAGYGFERFSDKASSLIGIGGVSGPRGDGEFLQTIDTSLLSEGVHHIEARAFRHRTDGGPAVFSDFRKSIYVDRLAPESTVLSFEPWQAGVNENRNLIVKSVDKTANAVHVFLDLPAAMTDSEILALAASGEGRARQIDRDQFIYGFSGLSHGNHTATIVTYELSGNANVQRNSGLFTSTIIGAGLGDVDLDGDIDNDDHTQMRALVDGNNAEFNAAADFDANGRINESDYRIFFDEFIDQVRGSIDFGDAPSSYLKPYFSDRITGGEMPMTLSVPGFDVNQQVSFGIPLAGISRDDTASDSLYFRFTANPTSIGDGGYTDAFAGLQLWQARQEGIGIGNRFGSPTWSYFGANNASEQPTSGDLNSSHPNPASPFELISENTPRTFLMRVDYKPGQDDVITVWMQPEDVFDDAQSTFATTTFIADASFDEMRVRAGSHADAAIWEFSDIHVSKQLNPGPAHLISNDLRMGFLVDPDAGQQTTTMANGDDNDGNDDDDGILYDAPIVAGSVWPLDIGASGTGKLDGWIDFNQNGQFDHPAEHIGSGVSIDVGLGLTTINVPIPTSARSGDTAMRLRISTAGGLTPHSYAVDGEVEDHVVSIQRPTIVGRAVAYRGATAAYGDGTIDPTKSALRDPGASASLANYTNYTQGLNRVIVDIDNLTATELTASDFEFRVGNSEDFGNNLAWTSMPPSAINVTPLSSTAKRITIDWPHKAIMNQWLEVTVKANENTHLEQDDVFYFGNQVGDVDGSTSTITNRVTVNAFDALDVRFSQSPGSNSVGIGHLYDVDRSGSVNAFDVLDVRFNQMPSGGLMMITLPAAIATISSTWLQNPDNAMDVNGDGQITPMDALIGINFLNQADRSSSSIVSGELPLSPERFYDVNGDGRVTALDSLLVINKLGSKSIQQAERLSIPLLDLESDREDELDWVSDRPLQQDNPFDLALSNWDEDWIS